MQLDRIRKGAYKDYLGNAIFGGLALGLIFFLVSIPNNGVRHALRTGLLIGFVLVPSIMILGFIYEEWFKRNVKIKKLNSEIYKQLRDLGLQINNNLDYVGQIERFDVRFNLSEKWIKKNKYEDCHAVDIICYPNDFNNLRICIENIRKLNGIKNAAWGYGYFSIWISSDFYNFGDLLNNVIRNLQKYSLKPIANKNDISTIDNQINNEIDREVKKRYVQILKFWKIDKKYEKPIK